ncbi:MAG: hypothetical protein IPH72_27180 [Sandaracinaceae bacterium]|nr:hypothetical protein [Sandaracinaceae bacterium]
MDTDAQVRVRAPSVTAPGPVTLTLARAASVARVPVVVTAFAVASLNGEALEALGSVVTDTDQAQLVLPADVPQLVYFRARPLVDGREVRGSFTSTWVRRSDALTPVVRFDPSGRALVSGLPAGTPFLTLAMPADEARGLYREGSEHTAIMAVSALEAEARLARFTPADSAAPVRQQGTSLVPQPMPEDSVQRGLLRDPWRASSRFIEGRLALLLPGRWRRAWSPRCPTTSTRSRWSPAAAASSRVKCSPRSLARPPPASAVSRSRWPTCRRSTAASASTTRRAASRVAACSASW